MLGSPNDPHDFLIFFQESSRYFFREFYSWGFSLGIFFTMLRPNESGNPLIFLQVILVHDFLHPVNMYLPLNHDDVVMWITLSQR